MSKRSLPVLKSQGPQSSEPDDATTASVLVWTSAGVVMAFLLWLPLASLAASLSTRLAPELAGAADAAEIAERLAAMSSEARDIVRLRISALQLCALGLSHLLAGFMVGYFSKESQLRQWALIGIFTGGIAALLSLGSGFSWGLLLPLPLASISCAAGGWFGRQSAR